MRILNSLKNNGLIIFFIKLSKKILYRLFVYLDNLDIILSLKRNENQRKKNKEKYKQIENLFKNPKYKYIFVFYPYTEWNLPVFQRPQQIALAMTKSRDDVLYFFCSANLIHDNINIIEQINENLYLCTDFDFLTRLKTNKRIIHLYSTDISSKKNIVIDALNRKDKIVYEYIDEIHPDITKSVPKHFMDKHNFILENENCYIVTSATKLYNDVKLKRNKNLILSTNGVTLEDFSTNKNLEIPDRMKSIRNNYKKIIGYYGSLAKWVNYDLLNKIAKKYSDYAIVLIGIEYDFSLKQSGILSNNNIFFLGKIDYKNLINYSSQMDLLIIPFLINEITASTSPVKLFEYMASKKPILTTAMEECKKYKSVNIANSDEEFIKKIPDVIKLKNNTSYTNLLFNEASQNTWEQKANSILNMLKM